MEREINGKKYKLIGINKSDLNIGEDCKGCVFDQSQTGVWCGNFIDDTCCDFETKEQEFIWKLIDED